ncbi:MAG: MFS transporter [Achromobacter sp.]|uniref:MFS transporter n=1 Tax=unclassified Achromobacter TaxID=2626865 RepID=UPI001C643C53|nr:MULTISPECIES: MFS transporter [unclassified Achromobacter]MDX3984359.1 MFS transporter [Achromobacter sp.]QYJ20813.1 MFS transporter [Achromobacter sp. ES-001]
MLRARQRFLILALITIVLAFSTGDRATLSVAGSGMSKELGLSPVQMGWLFSSFAWAYVLAHVPAGWLVDRLGAKRTVLGGLVLWSACTMFMGAAGWFASAFAALLVLRFLLGTFEAPVGPASGRVIAAWFPAQERGVAGAIFNSAQYLSLALFTPLMGWLDHMFGWEHVFSVMGALGLLLALLWWRAYQVPTEHPKLTAQELELMRNGGALVDLPAHGVAPSTDGDVQPDADGMVQRTPNLLDLFRSRMLTGIFLAQYCITAITWFFVSWFPTYLVKERGMSILTAGFVASLPAIAGCVGGVLTGFVSDWLLKRTQSLTIARKVPITIGLLLTSVMIGCNYVDTDWIVVALMSLAFFGKGFGSLGWTVVADTAPKSMIGLTGGVFNAVGNTAGITTPVVIGYILGTTGSFHQALVFVGLHGVVAVASYWLLVGRIQRFEPKRRAPALREIHARPSNP